MYFVTLLGVLLLVGVIGVVSNPSSCFGVNALVVAGLFGGGVLSKAGCFFLALVLFLVYLGGMLVVFAYSVAFSSDLFPEAWGGGNAGFYMMSYILVGFVLCGCCGVASYSAGSYELVVEMTDLDVGFGGVSMLFGVGGPLLIITGIGLLLTLFVVLELVRGVSFGALFSTSK